MGASSNTFNWRYGVHTIKQDDSIFWTSGLSQLTLQGVKLVCVAVDTGIRSRHLMDFHITRCWWTAKLATNNSFHLILKGIPDTTMKRPCSGYHGSRHTFFWPMIQCMGQSLNGVTMTDDTGSQILSMNSADHANVCVLTLGSSLASPSICGMTADMGWATGNWYVSSFPCAHWCKLLEFLFTWLLVSPVHWQRRWNWYAQGFQEVVQRPSDGKEQLAKWWNNCGMQIYSHCSLALQKYNFQRTTETFGYAPQFFLYPHM